MSWTKRALIKEAMTEIGIADYEFDVKPEEQQSALRRLDSMMALWYSKAIVIGYALPDAETPSDLDQPSGLADEDTEAVFLMLAIRLAPGFGKTLPIETRVLAKQAYDAVVAKCMKPIPPMQLPANMPLGAGFKTLSNRPVFATPVELLETDVDFLEI